MFVLVVEKLQDCVLHKECECTLLLAVFTELVLR